MDLDFLVYQVLPYIALTTLIVGSVARYERDPFTWKSSSTQLLRRRQLMWGSVLFHIGVLVIAAGHLIGLLTPIWIFDAVGISHGAKQIAAIVGGGIAAVLALIGGALLLHRRLFDPRIRANSTVADTGILILLLFQLVLGIGTIGVSIDHLSGEEMVKFMGWAQGLATFRMDAYALVVDVHWIFKLHLFFGMVTMILVPFTRLVHIFSAPLSYLWRPGYQVVRSRRRRPHPVRGRDRTALESRLRPQGAGVDAQPRPAE